MGYGWNHINAFNFTLLWHKQVNENQRDYYLDNLCVNEELLNSFTSVLPAVEIPSSYCGEGMYLGLIYTWKCFELHSSSRVFYFLRHLTLYCLLSLLPAGTGSGSMLLNGGAYAGASICFLRCAGMTRIWRMIRDTDTVVTHRFELCASGWWIHEEFTSSAESRCTLGNSGLVKKQLALDSRICADRSHSSRGNDKFQ